MKNLFFILLILLAISCSSKDNCTSKSPDGNVVVDFQISEGIPTYSILYKNSEVILPSSLGLDFKDISAFGKNVEIFNVEKSSFSEKWEMPWGEKRWVDNTYNQLSVVLLKKESGMKVNLVFKVYNDGVGFRYEFPEQNNIDSLTIMHENTEFALADNSTCWWQAGDWDSYELLYHTTRFSEIDAFVDKGNEDVGQTYIPYNAVNTPVTMKTESGVYLSFHEADLTDYAGMTLKVDTINLKMVSELVGSKRLGYKAKCKLPFHTPWRTIQITDRAGELIESDLIENLCEPNKLGDIPWFKPTKYVGVWWEMHVGKSTFDISSSQALSNNLKISRHGATTEHAKELIDFASENNIHGILVEGWNTGWEHWSGFEDREGVFDFVTSYPDYNLTEVVKYGKERGVDLIVHNETSAAPRTYEQQLDTAYALIQSLDLHAIKTGYVGQIIPKGEYHHGQWMVKHYQRVVEKAAQYQIAVNAHEPIKATGKRRTWPNIISREGVRGQEYNAWDAAGGNPPEHLPIVVFTRMLSGPIDFTPGIFNIKLNPYQPNNQVNTTLAKQLALYVIIDSPIQMVADLIDNYKGHPALQFIRDVGVNWEQTKVLNAEVGDYVTIARKERETGNWFLGSITDENSRDFKVALDFLPEGKTFEATIYADGDDADWDKNPTSYKIYKQEVNSNSVLSLKLAAGGGVAISFMLK